MNISGIAAGNYTVTATYNADGTYNTKVNETTFTVARAASTVVIDDSPSIRYGDNATVTVSINENATGNILFYVDG